MDEHQIIKLNLLSKCTFQVGSFDKRFVRNLHAAANPQTQLTEKQAICLEQIFHRYRRQISNHKQLCKVCSGEVPEARHRKRSISNPDDEIDKLEKWIKSVEGDRQEKLF